MNQRRTCIRGSFPFLEECEELPNFSQVGPNVLLETLLLYCILFNLNLSAIISIYSIVVLFIRV